MHLKRQKAPKNWPISRKGSVYVVRPSSNLNHGIPILIILRDILKVAQNRKEVKKALHNKQILLNENPVSEEKNTALLFDVIKILPFKKNYRVILSENGKLGVNEIKDSEANKKVAKVINKKILKKKKVQLNLSDGRNFISDIECSTNDSVLINLKDKKMEKCLPLKEKANAFVFEGKHAGKKGLINKIDQEKKIAELNVDKKQFNILIKQLIVIE